MNEQYPNQPFPEIATERRIDYLVAHFLGNKISILMAYNSLNSDAKERLGSGYIESIINNFIAGLEYIVQKIESGEVEESEIWTKQKIQEIIVKIKDLDLMDEQAVRRFYEENPPKF